MNYGEILSKAWKTVWKHKVLWIFGLLASCGQSGGSNGGSGNAGYQFDGGETGNMQLPQWMENFGHAFERAASDGSLWIGMTGIILALIVILLLLAVIGLVLSTIGKTGLVRGTWDVEEGTEKLTFGALFKQSLTYFWKVLGFNVLAWIGQFVLGFIALFPVLLLTIMTLGCGLLVIIPVLIAASLFINVLIQFSVVAIVGEDRGVFAGIERAWNLITGNLGPVAVITLILVIGTWLVQFLFALPVLLVAAPVAIGFINGTQQAINTGLIVGGGFLFIYILVIIFLSAILYAYLGAAWTLAFRAADKRSKGMRVAAPPVLPKPPVVDAKAKPIAPPVKAEPKAPASEPKGATAPSVGASTVKFTKEELAAKKANASETARISKDEIESGAKKIRRTSQPPAGEDLPKPD
ncbi:MAG: hypothetical protein HPY76_06235 [Anaerolineae bacterium]|nr:hypothetical protein [Anaerolineae bacterium]